MITELLGLAGSGVLGSVFGIVSDMMSNAQARKEKQVELDILRERRLNGQIIAHLDNPNGFVTGHTFGYCFGMLCATYCACALLCFVYPNVEILTFNPDDEPKRISILWGLFSWERQVTHVYTITTGGVGYALLHPLAFQIGTVITGINANPKR